MTLGAAPVHPMSGGVMAFLYAVAVVAFVLAAVGAWPRSGNPNRPRRLPPFVMTLVAVGLACCAFVLCWNALAVS